LRGDFWPGINLARSDEQNRFATKSARLGPPRMSAFVRLLGAKRTLVGALMTTHAPYLEDYGGTWRVAVPPEKKAHAAY
jgi:hypothetical protein